LTPLREVDIRWRRMRAFYIAGIASVALPFAAIETANAAGIVSHNGGRAIQTASADLLAGPGRNGKKNRGFRFAAPNVAAAVRHSDAGTPVFGGTLSLSGGVTKTGLGTLRIGEPTTSLSAFSGISFLSGGTLNVGGATTLTGSSTIDLGTTPAVGNVSGGTLLVRPTTDSVRINGSGGAVVINPAAVTNFWSSSDVVNFSGGTINVLPSGLLRVGSGTLTITRGTLNVSGLNEGPAGGAGAITLTGGSTIDFASGAGSNLLFSHLNYTSGGTISIRNWSGWAGSGSLGANTLTGTVTLETSQTLDNLVIGSSEGIVIIGNGVAPPPPVEDASNQGGQPVPEPSTAALFAMSAAALLTRRARK
jgi:hypothetical protein